MAFGTTTVEIKSVSGSSFNASFTIPSGCKAFGIAITGWASGGISVTSVTMSGANSGAMTAGGQQNVVGDANGHWCFYKEAPAAGSTTVSVVLSATPAEGPLFSAHYVAADGTVTLVDSDAANDAASGVSVTSTSATGDLAIGHAQAYGTAPHPGPSGTTDIGAGHNTASEFGQWFSRTAGSGTTQFDSLDYDYVSIGSWVWHETEGGGPAPPPLERLAQLVEPPPPERLPERRRFSFAAFPAPAAPDSAPLALRRTQFEVPVESLPQRRPGTPALLPRGDSPPPWSTWNLLAEPVPEVLPQRRRFAFAAFPAPAPPDSPMPVRRRAPFPGVVEELPQRRLYLVTAPEAMVVSGAATYDAWSAAGAASEEHAFAGAAAYDAWSGAGTASETASVVGAAVYDAWSAAGAASETQSVIGAALYDAWGLNGYQVLPLANLTAWHGMFGPSMLQ